MLGVEMRLRVCIAGLAITVFTPLASEAAREISPDIVAANLVSRAEVFVRTLNVHSEEFSVRINRCQGRRGEIPDDRFYAWVGWRGVVPANDALDSTRVAESRAAGWKVTRDRRLENGGLNVAAIDLVSDQTFSLDSGFDSDPGRYIVGFFHTKFFHHNAPIVSFGPWKAH